MRLCLASFSIAMVALTSISNSGEPAFAEEGLPNGIVWYGVLTDGLAEAERTGKPILLVSAAPNCIGVSGIW